MLAYHSTCQGIQEKNRVLRELLKEYTIDNIVVTLVWEPHRTNEPKYRIDVFYEGQRAVPIGLMRGQYIEDMVAPQEFEEIDHLSS